MLIDFATGVGNGLGSAILVAFIGVPVLCVIALVVSIQTIHRMSGKTFTEKLITISMSFVVLAVIVFLAIWLFMRS